MCKISIQVKMAQSKVAKNIHVVAMTDLDTFSTIRMYRSAML